MLEKDRPEKGVQESLRGERKAENNDVHEMRL
jgi:hypothetical protein